ncbi:MAG: hypothetical protein ACLQVD_09975 [Capsulimonadaceae bacterium]
MPLSPDVFHKSIELTEQADLLLLDGDSDQVRLLLEQALALNPANAEARRMLDGMLARHPASVSTPSSLTSDTGHTGFLAADIPPQDSSRFEPASVQPASHAEIADLLHQARASHLRRQTAGPLLRRVLEIDPGNRDANYLLDEMNEQEAVRTLHTQANLANGSPYHPGLLGREREGARGFMKVPRPLRLVLAIGFGELLMRLPGRHDGRTLVEIWHLNPVQEGIGALVFALIVMVSWEMRSRLNY